MRTIFTLIAGLALFVTGFQAGSARAQSEASSENVRIPFNPQRAFEEAALELKLRGNMSRECDTFGCFQLINETKDYAVVQFRLASGGRNEAPLYGQNLIRQSLAPRRKAPYLPMFGDQTMCQTPALFVLRHRKTKELIFQQAPIRLCATPMATNIFRISVPDATVTLEGAAAEQN